MSPFSHNMKSLQTTASVCFTTWSPYKPLPLYLLQPLRLCAFLIQISQKEAVSTSGGSWWGYPSALLTNVLENLQVPEIVLLTNLYIVYF